MLYIIRLARKGIKHIRIYCNPIHCFEAGKSCKLGNLVSTYGIFEINNIYLDAICIFLFLNNTSNSNESSLDLLAKNCPDPEISFKSISAQVSSTIVVYD